jgi:hypothetical protein
MVQKGDILEIKQITGSGKWIFGDNQQERQGKTKSQIMELKNRFIKLF